MSAHTPGPNPQEAEVLETLNEQNRERVRRDWFRCGVRIVLSDVQAEHDLYDEEIEALEKKAIAFFDENSERLKKARGQ